MAETESQKKQAKIDKLVVGLGNPGDEYTRTRHNLGFRALDAFLQLLGVPKDFRPAMRSRVQVVCVDGKQVLLARPTTYMNLSGSAVAGLLGQTGLGTSDLLVVHDEMDLDCGRMKMRMGGGAAGHRGVGDVIEKCGEDFARIKIGIGPPPEPFREDAAEWLLTPLDSQDGAVFEEMLPRVAQGIKRWIVDGTDKAMTWLNTDMNEPDEPPGSHSCAEGGGSDG